MIERVVVSTRNECDTFCYDMNAFIACIHYRISDRSNHIIYSNDSLERIKSIVVHIHSYQISPSFI